MKKLELLIPHERLEAVNELLHKHNVGGMTCYDVKGRGQILAIIRDRVSA